MERPSRREFLGWTAAGAAGLLLPELIRPRVTTVVFGSGLRVQPFWTGIIRELESGRWVWVEMDGKLVPFRQVIGSRICPSYSYWPGE